jgi:hypothetical protein
MSQLEKEMDQQRRSFTVSLKPDNALDGLLALNASGQAADDPLMRSLNMTAIAEITADGAMDVDELRYLVGRVGALNEVYSVDQFEALMRQVETNYRGASVRGVARRGVASCGLLSMTRASHPIMHSRFSSLSLSLSRPTKQPCTIYHRWPTGHSVLLPPPRSSSNSRQKGVRGTDWAAFACRDCNVIN